jgi:xanthine/uracil permease
MTRAGVHPVDEMLPPGQLATLGLQHVLVMYAGAVAVPLIIGGALKMSTEQIAWLISADLFCCGIVTLIQCMGLGNVGIRMPVMMGVAFTAIAPIIATGSNPQLGMPAVFGAVIASGVFTYFAAPYVSRLIRWFPPVVTGTVVLVIGVSLMKVGVHWSAGGPPMIGSPSGPIPNPEYGQPMNLAIAATVLVSILAMVAFFKGFIANIAVLLGILLGNIFGGIFGTFTYTSYSQNVGLVQPTGVRSRWVVAASGVILVILGCLPKLSYLVAAVPHYVFGGAAIVMFGMVAATGVKILGTVDFSTDRKNLYIVAVSLGLGMIPLVADRFFLQLPELMARFFQNGILLGTLCAVLLNALFHRGQCAPGIHSLEGALDEKAA